MRRATAERPALDAVAFRRRSCTSRELTLPPHDPRSGSPPFPGVSAHDAAARPEAIHLPLPATADHLAGGAAAAPAGGADRVLRATVAGRGAHWRLRLPESAARPRILAVRGGTAEGRRLVRLR